MNAHFDATTLDAPYPVFDPLKSLPARIRTKISEYAGSGVGGGGSGSDFGTLGSRGGQGGQSRRCLLAVC